MNFMLEKVWYICTLQETNCNRKFQHLNLNEQFHECAISQNCRQKFTKMECTVYEMASKASQNQHHTNDNFEYTWLLSYDLSRMQRIAKHCRVKSIRTFWCVLDAMQWVHAKFNLTRDIRFRTLIGRVSNKPEINRCLFFSYTYRKTCANQREILLKHFRYFVCWNKSSNYKYWWW